MRPETCAIFSCKQNSKYSSWKFDTMNTTNTVRKCNRFLHHFYGYLKDSWYKKHSKKLQFYVSLPACTSRQSKLTSWKTPIPHDTNNISKSPLVLFNFTAEPFTSEIICKTWNAQKIRVKSKNNLNHNIKDGWNNHLLR